ncbi:DUF1616 domain-containing protein [Halomicrococcus sp. SG-WS-1]|uniref:DUF1616 domain-containing protein n=1 Tax=Halomicrococcus sp. SG-WS-1 TaxID=3439057 RepID=UPI003F78BFC5
MSHDAADSGVKRFGALAAFPLDLAALVAFVGVVNFALSQPLVRGTPLAVALGLPLVFFAPGYAVLAALFPGSSPGKVDGWVRTVAGRREQGITTGERLALAFGTSVALLPPLWVALSLAGVDFTPLTVLAAVSGLTFVGVVGGAVRRARIPPGDRYDVPLRSLAGRFRESVTDNEDDVDAALNVALALAIVAATASIGFAVAVPTDGERFSHLSLLTRGEDGDLVEAGYPENVTAGEDEHLTVAVENHEGRTVEYTLVVELQRVEEAAGGGGRVVEQTELRRTQHSVAAGKTWRTRDHIEPTMTGEDLRLTYLLYEGEPPADPSKSNADQHAHIWINVTAASGGEQ